jgi:hypothetical protein
MYLSYSVDHCSILGWKAGRKEKFKVLCTLFIKAKHWWCETETHSTHTHTHTRAIHSNICTAYYVPLHVTSVVDTKSRRRLILLFSFRRVRTASLTLSLLMSCIHGAPCKARNFNVVYICIYIYIYMDVGLATLKAVSFYLLHNVSTLN